RFMCGASLRGRLPNRGRPNRCDSLACPGPHPASKRRAAAHAGRAQRTGRARPGGPSTPAPGFVVVDAGLQHHQPQDRALNPHVTDGEAQPLEHVVLGQGLDLLQRLALDLVGQDGRGGLADGAALALEADVGDAVLVVQGHLDVDLVAAERVVVLVNDVRVLQPAVVARAAVVLEDVLPVHVSGHRLNTFRAAWTARTSASISSGPCSTAKLAGAVAGTPNRSCSGMQQWCPARMATPSVSTRLARSWAWISSRLKATSPARRSGGGPYTVTPGTSSSASWAWA